MDWISLWFKVHIVGWALGILIPVVLITGAWLFNSLNGEKSNV